MRKLSVFFLLLSAGCASAQEIPQANVPAVVVNAFQQKFPQQVAVEWELKKGLYEAEFEIENLDHNVYIDSTGKIVRYKKEITTNELPAAVNTSIQKNFKGYKIEDIKRIEEATGITYKVELEKGEVERNVTFAVDGKIVENIVD
ncbi:PepSY-like domain-containing protein [Cytophaga aurantiaca]|uniref:PepSY-like domain-containing protein n=1 Tax=Cytophaga aurantiaca TaxID=29530 RepID=UPI0003A87AA5|nr:PepSY-like domain-containing protein [Cytophaga aurantiaca]